MVNLILSIRSVYTHTTRPRESTTERMRVAWHGLSLVVVPVVSTTQSIIMKWSSWVKLEIAFPEVFSSFLFFLFSCLTSLHSTYNVYSDKGSCLCSMEFPAFLHPSLSSYHPSSFGCRFLYYNFLHLFEEMRW